MFPNPFATWLALADSARLIGETMQAATTVVEARSRTIGSAMTDPLGADTAELHRMIDEKTASFSAAGASLANGWMKVQSDCLAQAMAVGTMMLSGRMPGPRAARAMVARSQRIGASALATGNRAMAPVHAAATANARRLGKRKR